MSDKDVLSAYAEQVKWIVGLSGAAVGGALLHFEQFTAQREAVRAILATGLVLFLASILGGVIVLLWIAEVPTHREVLHTIQVGLPNIGLHSDINAMVKAKQKSLKALHTAQSEIPIWHKVYMGTFSTALLCSAVGILLAGTLFGAQKSQPVAPTSPGLTHDNPDFTIAYSAVHNTGHGHEAHTFLLNQATGEIWQMTCRKDGGIVFQRVHKLGFDGNLEDVAPTRSRSK